MIDCGEDDFFIDINRTLHSELLIHGIIHDYVERPGGHQWSYWIDALDYHMVFFKKQM
jgi:enterochelin esterase-like enzyme